MLTEERHNEIVALVEQNGSVRVKDLSQRFGVTEDCIRKDLTQLQKRWLLKKTYGGAMKVRSTPHEFNVSDRKGNAQRTSSGLRKRRWSWSKAEIPSFWICPPLISSWLGYWHFLTEGLRW